MSEVSSQNHINCILDFFIYSQGIASHSKLVIAFGRIVVQAKEEPVNAILFHVVLARSISGLQPCIQSLHSIVQPYSLSTKDFSSFRGRFPAS